MESRWLLPTPSRAELARRMPLLLIGLSLFGWGIVAMIKADLGLGPWDVLHQGISKNTGIPIGTVGIFVGFAVLALWPPLKERVGIGTLFNVIQIGIVIDVTDYLTPDPEAMWLRIVLMLSGPVLIALGSGLYIGSGLGAGPRDGVMTGLARRGWRVDVARTVIEATVLVLGFLLGGTAGVGTLVFAFGIGPLVDICLKWFTLPPLAGYSRGTHGAGEAADIAPGV